MEDRKLTKEQELHIEIDGIVSDLADLAIQWDDPTDYPSMEVDRASNQIMEIVFTYVDDKFTELIGEDEDLVTQSAYDLEKFGMVKSDAANWVSTVRMATRNSYRAELRALLGKENNNE